MSFNSISTWKNPTCSYIYYFYLFCKRSFIKLENRLATNLVELIFGTSKQRIQVEISFQPFPRIHDNSVHFCLLVCIRQFIDTKFFLKDTVESCTDHVHCVKPVKLLNKWIERQMFNHLKKAIKTISVN